MLDDLHIVDFCNDVARYLLLLHRQFPRQIEVYISDIIGHEEPDEYGLFSKRHESCLSTVLWLKAEGWLRFDNIIRREAVDQCVLTQKAFQELHRPLPATLALHIFHADTDSVDNHHSLAQVPANVCLIQGLHAAHHNQNSESVTRVVMHLLNGNPCTQ